MASETGLFLSEVLSTFSRPTIDLVMPCTVPVKIGFNLSAFLPTVVSNAPATVSNIARVESDSGLSLSEVLLTLSSPTIVLVMPFIVLVNDTGPLSNTGPLIDVVPVRTAFDESALLCKSSTLLSIVLTLAIRLYVEIK